MKITGNLQYLVLFYCLPYNTLYHLRDWLHGVKRFALSECILFVFVSAILLQIFPFKKRVLKYTYLLGEKRSYTKIENCQEHIL